MPNVLAQLVDQYIKHLPADISWAILKTCISSTVTATVWMLILAFDRPLIWRLSLIAFLAALLALSHALIAPALIGVDHLTGWRTAYSPAHRYVTLFLCVCVFQLFARRGPSELPVRAVFLLPLAFILLAAMITSSNQMRLADRPHSPVPGGPAAERPKAEAFSFF